MKHLLFAGLALAVIAAPLTAQTITPTIDSSYVIPVRAGTDRASAYDRAAAALVAQGFAITGAAPGLALSGAATEDGMITVNVSIAPDGTAYCSAQLVIGGGGGAIVGGTGAISGGGTLAVQRGSRTGKRAWERLERLANALALPTSP